MNQENPHIPVNVSLLIADADDTPYPLMDNQYQRVKNYGTPENPRAELDHHGLTETEIVQGLPPIEVLTTLEADSTAERVPVDEEEEDESTFQFAI
jgi:hypothetical protein